MATHQAKSKFAQFFNSPTGPRTVHFWAPVMKWSLVIAGANDMSRPVEQVSGSQQVALMATGLIWTRWCMIIKPRNILLASVNFFLGAVAGYQVVRLFNYQRSLGNSVTGSLAYIIQGPPSKPEQKEAVAAAPANA